MVHAGEVVDLISDMLPAAVIVEHVVSQAIRLLGAVSGRAEWSLR